ncbi:MAG: 4-hydroxythreonine-4-phosphate dehydrogenase PdxA [Akkermansia sp.]|nr:4-hydroxythreonine-4-phosphate dehydrogenase PdxA [Akkermansia sp.]MBR2314302.1 4-hydroxythreonine-4-phosphate dehydrogenase PdxA [Akkermansia sp.]
MSSSPLQRPVIGYTLGDQAGIGPEIVRAALKAMAEEEADFLPMGPAIAATPGVPTRETAAAALEQLETAASALREGRIDAVVTAPVCKEGLHQVGFTFPGQTEFFADRLNVQNFAMCLTGRHLTVALGTIHTALADVPALLTADELVRIGSLLADFVRSSGIPTPRIAIAGLNPHNGENGAFGDEERLIFTPVVARLQADIPWASFTGPCVPDCVYRDAAMGQFDAVLAPYHDQALIPLKLLDFDNAVNVTLGLPRYRTSPDHGTAFSIAGKGLANPASTIRAFELALACAHAR